MELRLNEGGFWAELQTIKRLMFEESQALGENANREILAGIQNDYFSVELNLYPINQSFFGKEGRYAYAEYYICEC